jgi:hypothetical protein
MLMTLLIALLIGNGCAHALMNLSSSAFLSNFSLEDLVKRNGSPSGQLCAGGGMGGGGGTGSSVGHGRSSSHKSTSFSCQIKSTGESSFDEAAFLASLKVDVEKEIAASGAKVVGEGSSGPAGFYFEYIQQDIRGRVEISGKKSGTFYTLEAKLIESTEPREGNSPDKGTV